MPRSRRSLSGFARGAPRRLTSWALGPGGDDLGTMDAQVRTTTGNIIYGSGVTPVVPNLTIVRTRGFVDMRLLSATAVGDGFNYALGLGIVTNDAFSIGVTATPNPFDDADWPGWLWHDMGTLKKVLGDVDGLWRRVEIDSKAMRKLRQNEVYGLYMDFAQVASGNLEVTAATRSLFKLP